MAPSKTASSEPRFTARLGRDLRLVELGRLGIKIPGDFVADLEVLCTAYQIDRETAVKRAVDAYPECDKSMAVTLYILSYLRDMNLLSKAPIRDWDDPELPPVHRVVN